MNHASTGGSGGRPVVLAPRAVVSTGHYLATEIALDVLRRGGNAMDAAAAAGFALALLKPHQNGIGGEAPTLVYSAGQKKVWAVSGHGVAPRQATLEHFRGLCLKVIPGDGFLPAIVPSVVATYLLLLERFGSMRLSDVLTATVELAEQGWPMYGSLHAAVAASADRFRREWPSSAEMFLPGGQIPAPGAIWRQPDWAQTFRGMLQAEERFRDRREGLRAACDFFYRGPVARTIAEFVRANPVRDATGQARAGLLTAEDFAAFGARVEEPVRTAWRGLTVFKCGPWTQGPVLLQSLNLLEGFDLVALGHNSADYVHAVVECMKLAFADREFHYGDPDFAPVPMDLLLSKEHAAERRRLVDMAAASPLLRPTGYPPVRPADAGELDAAFVAPGPDRPGDTTKLEVIDSSGNMVSATPSGGWLPSSPVVAGLGFPLGTRGQMFSLAAGHPNCLAPGKRPRTTLTPTLVLREGGPFLAFGSPGGDSQDQWALQFFLNVVEFGMSLQQAVEAPTFWTNHFPSSFHPRRAEPLSLHVEGRIPAAVREELARRGHAVTVAGDWSGGNTLAAGIDPDTGARCAAASPRLDPAAAAGW